MVLGGGLTTAKDWICLERKILESALQCHSPGEPGPECSLSSLVTEPSTAPQVLCWWVPRGSQVPLYCSLPLLVANSITHRSQPGLPTVLFLFQPHTNWTPKALTTDTPLRHWGLVPDHSNKANIVIKQVTQIFWFPSTYKIYVNTLLSIMSAMALRLKNNVHTFIEKCFIAKKC